MNAAPAGSRSAALVGVLLALPFATMFTLLTLRIEPALGPLEPLVTAPPDQPNVIGTGIVLGAWLLALVAFVINVRPLITTARSGISMMAHPINLTVAAISLFFVVAFLGGIAVDQYPCWIGVPNCD